MGVTATGYGYVWYRTHAARRTLRFTTRRERQRLEAWRAAFLVGMLGTMVGMMAAAFSTLLVM